MIDAARVTDALAAVRLRIEAACERAGRDASRVGILAVTKGFGPEAPRAAMSAGLTDIGENYLQEASQKFAAIEWPPSVARHFIGRVQRNKARRIAELFDVVQTVDDVAIAAALDDAAAAREKRLDVLVHVNAAGDPRQGVAPSELASFVSALGPLAHLRVRGLMVMGPRDFSATASAFARARACFEQIRAASPEFDILSMGMSDDLEIAVGAGSTMVRIGTALFGVRPPKPVTA